MWADGRPVPKAIGPESIRGSGRPWKTPHGFGNEDRTGKVAGGGGELTRQATDGTGTKSLNPTFVEWLMGFPIGFTGCDALGMPSFRRWLRSHGECCESE